MRTATSRVLGAGLLLGVLAACTESPSSAPLADPFDLGAAVAAGPCSLLKDISADARSWFSQPEQKEAQTLVQTMSADCRNGMEAAVRSGAWQVIGLVEKVLEAGTGGDPAAGSRLVNGLLGCTGSLCEYPPDPIIDFTGALMSRGLFALRSGTTEPAIARGPVQFADLNGTTIDAWWGVEVDAPWADVTFTDPVLVYGSPVTSTGVPLSEAGIGNVQYQLGVFPDAGLFKEDALHVGACFSPEAVYDDGTNPLEPRMQREAVILEPWLPGFCGTVLSQTQTASVLGSFAALAKTFVAEPLLALFRAEKKAPAVGGTPLDFSRFAPVAANTNAYLEFVTQPDASPTAGQPIGDFQVRALTGAGTPMEKVRIDVYILNNQGVPAGAELSGDTTAITEELDGVQGIATFDNVIVGKPGGYTICATAGTQGGFTFADACSNVFNVKNAN